MCRSQSSTVSSRSCTHHHATPTRRDSPGDAVFDQGPFTLEFFQHELGHLLGFEHPFGPGGVYDDPYCVMGWSKWHDHPIPRPPEFADVVMLPGVDLWQPT